MVKIRYCNYEICTSFDRDVSKVFYMTAILLAAIDIYLKGEIDILLMSPL